MRDVWPASLFFLNEWQVSLMRLPYLLVLLLCAACPTLHAAPTSAPTHVSASAFQQQDPTSEGQIAFAFVSRPLRHQSNFAGPVDTAFSSIPRAHQSSMPSTTHSEGAIEAAFQLPVSFSTGSEEGPVHIVNFSPTVISNLKANVAAGSPPSPSQEANGDASEKANRPNLVLIITISQASAMSVLVFLGIMWRMAGQVGSGSEQKKQAEGEISIFNSLPQNESSTSDLPTSDRRTSPPSTLTGGLDTNEVYSDDERVHSKSFDGRHAESFNLSQQDPSSHVVSASFEHEQTISQIKKKNDSRSFSIPRTNSQCSETSSASQTCMTANAPLSSSIRATKPLPKGYGIASKLWGRATCNDTEYMPKPRMAATSLSPSPKRVSKIIGSGNNDFEFSGTNPMLRLNSPRKGSRVVTF